MHFGSSSQGKAKARIQAKGFLLNAKNRNKDDKRNPVAWGENTCSLIEFWLSSAVLQSEMIEDIQTPQSLSLLGSLFHFHEAPLMRIKMIIGLEKL